MASTIDVRSPAPHLLCVRKTLRAHVRQHLHPHLLDFLLSNQRLSYHSLLPPSTVYVSAHCTHTALLKVFSRLLYKLSHIAKNHESKKRIIGRSIVVGTYTSFTNVQLFFGGPETCTHTWFSILIFTEGLPGKENVYRYVWLHTQRLSNPNKPWQPAIFHSHTTASGRLSSCYHHLTSTC